VALSLSEEALSLTEEAAAEAAAVAFVCTTSNAPLIKSDRLRLEVAFCSTQLEFRSLAHSYRLLKCSSAILTFAQGLLSAPNVAGTALSAGPFSPGAVLTRMMLAATSCCFDPRRMLLRRLEARHKQRLVADVLARLACAVRTSSDNPLLV
jgi:hypothetical protein